MKNTFILTAFAAIAAAQSITDLPPCSLSCLTTAIKGLGCGLTDFACSCKKASELTPVITPCVQTACSDPADQSKTLGALAGICAAAGSPIENAAPASSALAEETSPTLPSEAPIETQPTATEEPEYPVYPTATTETTDATSEYPAPTHATDDVPNLPSSYSDLVPLPSFVDTIIVSRPSPHPTSVPGVLPPYPTGTSAPSVPGSSGGFVPSHTSSLAPPEFTGAAAAVQVPMIAAGVFGVAAFVL